MNPILYGTETDTESDQKVSSCKKVCMGVTLSLHALALFTSQRAEERKEDHWRNLRMSEKGRSQQLGQLTAIW
jgi:hypothetical protein